MSDHPSHLWHEDTRGVVRCAFQDCQAEPSEVEAAEAVADAETRATLRIELDWATR